MPLRDYQLEHIDNGIKELTLKRKVLMQLPTGGGKTVEFTEIIKRFLSVVDRPVLILVHRERLMHQAANEIEIALNYKPTLITSATSKFRYARVYIGMVESTLQRLELFDDVGLVIIDECHVANFNKVHKIFINELIMGFSATPIAASKNDPLNNYYNSIVCGPQIPELIARKYLCKNITRCPKNVVDVTRLEIDKLKGDFKEGFMAAEYSKPQYITSVIEAYFLHCKSKKTVIYNVTIHHNNQVAHYMKMCGINVRTLDSNTKDYEEVYEWFANTPDAVLCNVMIATVGIDEPTIQCIITNFSTLSLPKWIQTTGRGGRVIDDYFIEKYQHEYPYKLEKKDTFEIIDMGGNCIRFGDWSDERDWEKLFNNPKLPGDGIAPMKCCPQCEGMVHAALNVCNLVLPSGDPCLYVWDKRKKAEEERLKELQIITKAIDIDKMLAKNRSKYIFFTFFEIAEETVKAMFNNYATISDTIKDRMFVECYKLCCAWWRKEKAGKLIEGSNSGERWQNDITYSDYHIKRVKNVYNQKFEEYKKKYKEVVLIKQCKHCGNETDLVCEQCDFPVCFNCIAVEPTFSQECACIECAKTIA